MARSDNDNDNDDVEDDSHDYIIEGENEGGVFRWMSVAVVLLAVAGFFGLAWYAYKSGGEVIDEKDAELIQADASPVKEAPANPGGMPIPNQDKSVYDLVGGKKEPAKVVEHILAPPETPVAHKDDADTGTWMSDQVKNKLKSIENEKSGKPLDEETVPVAEKKTEETHAVKTEKAEKVTAAATIPSAVKSEQFKPEKSREIPKTDEFIVHEDKQAEEKPTERAKADEAPVVSPAPPAPAEELKITLKKEETKQEEVKESPKPEPKHAAEPVKQEKKKPEPAETKTSGGSPGSVNRAQLGAFKSQKEAEDMWKKISKKFGSDLSGKNHYVVRADLGAKGVFYRLQMAPFSSPADVEHFCISLMSEGQNCILAKGK